jgi:cytochrome oxidase Cu insertion factor (SCO1/SenC/PrrC family)
MHRARHNLALAVLIRRCLVVLALAALAVGLGAGSALADGDPASDVLVSQLPFIPSDTGATAAQQAKLTGLLRAAKAAGYPVRVAIIPDAYDLGSVTALWRKPQAYAHFLGIELSYVHKQPLLVVMPNGVGFDWEGHHAPPQTAALARLPRTTAGPGLLSVARSAVTMLAAGAHVKLAAPPSTTGARAGAKSGGITSAVLVALVVVLALVALGLATVLRWRPRGGEPKPAPARQTPAPQTPAPQTPRRSRPAWAIPGVVALMCVAVATPIVALLALRHPTGTSVAADTRVATPFTWPADSRPAPNFTLTDQRGNPVKLAAYRGRSVILTFVDPLCRNLCPLAAHVLNQVDANMPQRLRPVIIAVSVDIYADTRADLLQDFQKWSLVPQWQWAVGTPKQLAAVWRAYKIGVAVTTKRIAHTTVHFITHDEIAYVIDPSGHMRGLFAWPYYPQDVERFLRTL